MACIDNTCVLGGPYYCNRVLPRLYAARSLPLQAPCSHCTVACWQAVRNPARFGAAGCLPSGVAQFFVLAVATPSGRSWDWKHGLRHRELLHIMLSWVRSAWW